MKRLSLAPRRRPISFAHARRLREALAERRVALSPAGFEGGDVALRVSDRFAEPLLRLVGVALRDRRADCQIGNRLHRVDERDVEIEPREIHAELGFEPQDEIDRHHRIEQAADEQRLIVSDRRAVTATLRQIGDERADGEQSVRIHMITGKVGRG